MFKLRVRIPAGVGGVVLGSDVTNDFSGLARGRLLGYRLCEINPIRIWNGKAEERVRESKMRGTRVPEAWAVVAAADSDC